MSIDKYESSISGPVSSPQQQESQIQEKTKYSNSGTIGGINHSATTAEQTDKVDSNAVAESVSTEASPIKPLAEIVVKSMELPSSTISMESARQLVEVEFSHGEKLLKSLQQQHQSISSTGITEVYTEGLNKLAEAKDKALQSLEKNQNKKRFFILNPSFPSIVDATLKSARKDIAKTIKNSQLDIVEHLARDEASILKTRVDDRPTGRGSVADSVAIRTASSLSPAEVNVIAKRARAKADVDNCFEGVGKAIDKALNYFRGLIIGTEKTDRVFGKVMHTLNSTTEKVALGDATTGIEKDIQKELGQKKMEAIERRSDVIGLGGVYAVKSLFSKDRILHQLDSIKAQTNLNRERTVLDKMVALPAPSQLVAHPLSATINSKMIPLNSAFDAANPLAGHAPEVEKVVLPVFKTLAGDKGIPATHREENHLVNGYQTTLTDPNNGQVLLTAFRHGCIDNYTIDPTEVEPRRAAAKQMAGELLKAAVIQYMSEQQMNLDDASASEHPLEVAFSSISLMTPDLIRHTLHPGGHDDERMMLQYQIEALNSFDGLQTIEIDGKEVEVNFDIMAFNFGVNTGAADYKLGLDTQHAYNIKSVEKLKKVAKQSLSVLEHVDIGEYSTKNKNTEELISLISEGNQLLEDIELLTKSPDSYLKGGNQYEVGAKIIILMQKMGEIEKILKASGKSLPKGFMKGWNCKSGKDRSAIMDAMVKALILLGKERGTIPTHEEMQEPAVKERLAQLLFPMLKEGGGLEITEINTYAAGFKVGKEAQLGMSSEQFREIVGFSKFVKS